MHLMILSCNASIHGRTMHRTLNNEWTRKQEEYCLPSEPQEKLPWSRRNALNFLLPPMVRTWCTRRGMIFVIAAGRPSSNFLFLRIWGMRPPVFLRLCHLSWDIPEQIYKNSMIAKPNISHQTYWNIVYLTIKSTTMAIWGQETVILVKSIPLSK